MPRSIRLNFTDFWPGFDKTDNYFYRLLSTRYHIEISDNPDFLIYSCFGPAYRRHKCVRIFFTGENIRPRFWDCDYAFSFDYSERKEQYRLPFYALYLEDDYDRLVKKDLDCEAVLKGKPRFCNFVYSRPGVAQRDTFFRTLSKYKNVDSGGRHLNNVGGPVKDKLAFISQHKFTIAFENGSYPGYTSEKLVEPMKVRSLPIYWGNPLVHKDFNPRSFLNYHDFKTEEALIEKIVEIDRDDALYVEYLREPYYNNNVVNEYIRPENVLKQFDYIFNTPRTPVAQTKLHQLLDLMRTLKRVLRKTS